MARGRKVKAEEKRQKSQNIKNKLKGLFLVEILDENKQETYLPGIPWEDVVALYRIPKVKIIKIETIATEYYRPKDITSKCLKTLALIKK